MSKILEILQVLILILSFIVTIVEAVYEGIEKAGEQKKKDALAHWNAAKPHIVSVIREILGNNYASFVDKWVTDRVVSFAIDLLVWWFNMKGIFKKSA